MIINKEEIKIGMKNQLKTILHMLLVNVFTIIIYYIVYSFAADLGSFHTEGILPTREWSVNIYIYIVCMLVFISGYSIFWKKFLKEDVKKDIETHWSFLVIFIFLFIFFLIIQYIISVATFIIMKGFFGTIVNMPTSIIDFVVLIVYPIIYSTISIIAQNEKNEKILKEEE